MVRPLDGRWRGNPLCWRDCARSSWRTASPGNLSNKTVEWYNDRTRRFADWCARQGIGSLTPALSSAEEVPKS
jgi:hypothetical protein